MRKHLWRKESIFKHRDISESEAQRTGTSQQVPPLQAQRGTLVTPGLCTVLVIPVSTADASVRFSCISIILQPPLQVKSMCCCYLYYQP